MKVLKAVIWIMFFNTCIYAQTPTDSTYLKQVDQLFQKAVLFYGKNQDSLDYHLNQVKVIAKEHNDLKSYINSVCFSNRNAAYFYDQEKVRSNLKLLDSIVKNHESQFNTTENVYKLRNDINFDKGIYYYRINDFERSKSAFQAIINAVEKLPDSLVKAEHINYSITSYNYIAKIHSIDNKLDLAKNHYQKNIRYLERHSSKDIKKINRVYSLLAEVLKNQKDYTLSNKYFIKSLAHNLKNNGDPSTIVTEANHLLENYLSMAQVDSSKYYLDIIKNNLPEDHPRWNMYYEAKAKIHQTELNYPEAETALQKALKLTQKKWKEQPHNDVAEAYNRLGLLHTHFNNPTKAMINYDLALQQFSKNTNQSTINQTVVLKILKNKAQSLNTLSKHSETINTVNQAIETLDILKPNFKNNSDKLFLIDEAFPVFESGLEATYNLFQKQKDDALIEQAFYYSEKSKGVLLLESILSTKATKFANIPQDITEKEQVLKAKINRLEKQLNKVKSEKLEDELFKLQTDYRDLVTTIETQYKAYFDLKYNSEVITLKDLQKFLDPEDILISYFYGNKAIYSITVSKKTTRFERLLLDKDIEDNLIAVYNMLNDPKSDLKTLNSHTYNLFIKLVEPNLPDTSNKTESNLIVISDGLLNYIPFSSLNTQSGLPQYLIKDYAISYVNSATLLKQLSGNTPTNNEVLAFAPSFETSSALLPLPNNDTEAQSILNYFDGKTFINDAATLQNFNSESSSYGILHFATHAILNDLTPEYSYLAFQPDDSNSNLLYVSDLYNLNLNTNLVTLSACESGLGNLKRGEGFMSLARGFYFSGASSISSTLWKINDASSLKIMNAFYKNLSQSKTKNKALQLAKLEFIDTNAQNALAHPYYWSGFIISGDTSMVTSNHQWIWYLLGLVIIIVAGAVYRKRKAN